MDEEDGRRRREETTLQIRKTKKDARLAKRRQMPSASGGAGPTPAGMAAASMLSASGNDTYAGMYDGSSAPMSQRPAAQQSKLEHLPQMVAGVTARRFGSGW